MSESRIALEDAEWLDDLLRLPSREQQATQLREAGWLNESDLSRLLAQAMTLARSDPGKARRLTLLCEELAARIDAPLLIPRATYFRAQTHAINGEYTLALDLIATARDGYEAIGERFEALRTNVGLMHVLNELGRHEEALETGNRVVQALSEKAGTLGPPDAVRLLSALVNQNRGIILETTGRYEAALAAYNAAEEAFTALDMQERSADIRNNRGIVLVQLGRVSAAIEAFQSAATVLRDAGLTLLEAQTLSNIGEALLLLGRYTQSLRSFEQARRLFDSLDALAHQHILLRKTADAFLLLNLFPEALNFYQEAIAALEESGVSEQRARALWGMGTALIAESRYEEAEQALLDAAQRFEAAGNVPFLCSVMLEQAALLEMRGDHESALATAERALDLVAGDEWPVQKIYASMRVSDLSVHIPEAAERHLLAAEPLIEELSLPHIQYHFNRRLGHVRKVQGQEQEALSLLEKAVTQVEGLRGTLSNEALRTSFLQDKAVLYEELMQLHLERQAGANAPRALAVAEQAKSRTLVDLLTGVIEGQLTPAHDPDLESTLERLQADLNALYNQMLQGTGEVRDVTKTELHERIEALEGEIRQLRLKVVGSGSDMHGLSITLPVERLQGELGRGLTALAYHTIGNEIMAFVVDSERIRVVRGVSRTPVVQHLLQRLSIQWDRFRAGREFAQRHMRALQSSTERLLHSLYEELLAPVAPLLEATENDALLIVPHGILHQVPFHALFDGAQYLLDRWEISYAPSLTVFALCRQRRPSMEGLAVVVGVPDELIPSVDPEVQRVSHQLEEAGLDVQLLAASEASFAAVRDKVTGARLLHFACHGMFRADNPMFSALKLHDGWISAAEIFPLRLGDALVTLSACESGRSRVLLGDEVIGLPRAFLGAGAASLVVSLWLVQDETTAGLMEEWYTRLLNGDAPASALRGAQIAVRAHHPHPYYWAPFLLMGRR